MTQAMALMAVKPPPSVVTIAVGVVQNFLTYPLLRARHHACTELRHWTNSMSGVGATMAAQAMGGSSDDHRRAREDSSTNQLTRAFNDSSLDDDYS